MTNPVEPDNQTALHRVPSFESTLDNGLLPDTFKENHFVEPSPVFIRNMMGLHPTDKKKGGSNGAGERGGWYEDPQQNKFFIKQDVKNGLISDKINHGKNASEVIASRIMRLIAPEQTARIANVNFIVPSEETLLPDPTGSEVYVVSVGMGDAKNALEEKHNPRLDFQTLYLRYQDKNNNSLPPYEEVYQKLYHSPCLDLWEDAFLTYNFSQDPVFVKMREDNNNYLKPIPTDRPRNVGTINPFPIMNVIATGRYPGISELIALRVFPDDPDQTTANFVVWPIQGDTLHKRVGAIDFAAAMNGFDGKLHFLEMMRYLPGIGPTNHAREYPEEILICEASANQYKKIGNFPSGDILDELRNIMAEMDVLYDTPPLLEIAGRFGAPITDPENKLAILNAICNHLHRCFVSRQKEARELYYEISLSLCFEKCNGEFQYKADKLDFLDELILHNATYFREWLASGNFSKFHKSDQQDYYSSDRLNFLLAEKVKELLYGKKLSFRSTSTFHRIFNSGKIERFNEDFGLIYVMKSLMGYPNKSNPYNLLEWLATGFGLITFAKNLVKLAIEYLPEIAADFFQLVYENNQADLVKMQPLQNAYINAMLYFNMALAGIFHFTCKSIRLLTMRLTSPVQSFQQAYRYGASYSRVAGLLLASCSLMLTLNELSILFLVSAPLIAALSAAISAYSIGASIISGISTAANAILGVHTVASLVGLVNSAVSFLEMGLLTSIPTLATCITFFLLPFRSLFKATIKSAWNSMKVDVNVPPIFDEQKDYSSTQEISTLLDNNHSSLLSSQGFVFQDDGKYKSLDETNDSFADINQLDDENDNVFRPVEESDFESFSDLITDSYQKPGM